MVVARPQIDVPRDASAGSPVRDAGAAGVAESSGLTEAGDAPNGDGASEVPDASSDAETFPEVDGAIPLTAPSG
jgi:hypothetical protein